VLEELLAQGKRILLASTTNAAIDQLLAKLAARPWFAPEALAGRFIRLGRSEEDTFGAALADVVGRMQGEHRRSLDQLRAHLAEVEQQVRNGEVLLAELAVAVVPQQSIFAEPPARLDLEAQIIGNARVVMCTLTNVYLSPLMKSQRFDVLVAEEAGMAALPPLFYAACPCRDKAIMVGDPRQLPPIVHSREALVQRTIGRSVFEVTIPDPTGSDVVAILDVQYRMHPVIGGLVARLFYDGRLRHGANIATNDAIASRTSYPGMPLVVVDTSARTTCERAAKGNSRMNAVAAEVTAGLAFDAVTGGAGSVAVITPYAAQARDIRRLLQRSA
jgi:hypothetical protein